MDRQSNTAHTELKCILCNEMPGPKSLPLSLLEEITDDFSEEREIARGGFAVVYKGELDNGALVAVKRLFHPYKYETQFHRELECLIKVKHKNVVRFIGYCADSQGIAERYNGKFVMADVQQRLLCFEYLPRGTLAKYITDPSCGLDWRKRYKIINGICEGLHYLHHNQIVHLDLKPPNILLDDNMLPKIADFGLSRCFDDKQSHVTTKGIGGTLGYLAPEFNSRKITKLFDVYSLGVIMIEILTGKKGYEPVKDVLESWRDKLNEPRKDLQLEQVRVCTEIGMQCIDANPAKRPASIQHILSRLHQTGDADCSPGSVVTTSSTMQAESDYDDPNKDAPMAPRGTSSETSSVSVLVDELPSMAVPATSSDQLGKISAPKELGKMNTKDLSFSGSSSLLMDLTTSAQMSEVVLPALTKIGSILGDEATMVTIANLSKKATNLKKLPGQVELIGKQLSMMGIVIGKIGIVHLTDGIVKSWIGEVRKLAYRVEDIMDKCSYHVIKLNRGQIMKKFALTRTRDVKVFTEILDEVAEVNKEIQQVIQMKDQWLQPSQLVANPLTEMERQRSQDSFPGFDKDEDLVGIEENRVLLTEWLHSEELENTVITVSGMGGLGKSTLVSNVYEHEKINFSAHAWIVVSQVYTVDALLRKLLWKIGFTEQLLSAGIDKMDVHDLKKEIQQRLNYRKCLIVLDDVWEQEVYFQIHDAIQNPKGSRVIIMTQMDHVARISSPAHHLELQPLSKHDAFDLFCRRAFYNKKDHMCPEELETVASSIVDRCYGLPLAIVTIGSMLSSRQRLDFWKQTYNHLRNELSNSDQLREILIMSYHGLSGDLRNCLLYCSLFAVDQHISRESLVRLWVAEGFAASREMNAPEVVAERYLMELIHRNMLEVVEFDELGRVSTCKMHDIVRELAISIAKEQRFASANDYGTMIHMEKDVRRLSSWEWEDNTALKLKLPCLRTVLLLGVISPSPGMLSSILSESSYLTVLELQDSDITELPTSVGNLFNLRYIGLRRTKISSIPESIENLSNLHTIDIKQTKIEKLPRGIVEIKKLRHLLADRYADEKQTEFRYFVGVQAPKELSKLEELQTLETVESSIDLAEQLKKLMQLRSVWIDNISAADCANLFATLSTMPLLSTLLLSARDENESLCFETLKPRSTDLQRLIIRGQWAKGTLNCPIFQGHGRHLKYLALSWCYLGEDPVGMLAPHMPNLTYLRLNNVHSANTLVLSAGSFPNLTTLVLKHMPDVTEISIIDGALPCIEGLYIVSLSRLDKIPQGIESLQALKRLWLLGLHKDFRSQWVTDGMHHKMLHVPEVRV